MRLVLSLLLLLTRPLVVQAEAPAGPPFTGSTCSQPHEVIRRVRDCVVLIRHRIDQECLGSGTAIAVAGHPEATWILTCAHLFDYRVGSIEVTFAGRRPIPAEFVDKDPDNDLALLSVEPDPRWPAAALAAHGPRRGELLWQIGYPHGQGPRVQTGRCVQVGEQTRAGWRLQPGDSGGGIFNERGELCGVATYYERREPQVGNGASLEAIHAFLQSCWAPAEARRPTGPQPVVSEAVWGALFKPHPQQVRMNALPVGWPHTSQGRLQQRQQTPAGQTQGRRWSC